MEPRLSEDAERWLTYAMCEAEGRGHFRGSEKKLREYIARRERYGWVLAMAVAQSELYDQGDAELRNAVDSFVREVPAPDATGRPPR